MTLVTPGDLTASLSRFLVVSFARALEASVGRRALTLDLADGAVELWVIGSALAETEELLAQGEEL